MTTRLMPLPPILKMLKNLLLDLMIRQSRFGMRQLSNAKAPSKVMKKVFGLFHMTQPVNNYLHHHQILQQESGTQKQENNHLI